MVDASGVGVAESTGVSDATGVAVSVGVDVWVGVAVAEVVGVEETEGVGDALGVGLAEATAHASLTIVVLFKVTAALRAKSCPLIDEPPSSVIEVNANTWPTKLEPVPKVADEPTCQNTLQA
jgi:hypothetical protein